MKAFHRTYIDRDGKKRKATSWSYRFRWRWTDPDGERQQRMICQSGGSRNKRETETFGERHREALLTGKIGPCEEYSEARNTPAAPAAKPTLAEYASTVWEAIQAEVKPRTYRFYVETTERLLRLPTLALMPLDRIKGSTVKTYVAWRLRAKRGNSASAINAELRTLRRILHFAVDEDEILTGCPRIKTLPVAGGKEPITPEEEALYLAKAGGDLRDAFILLLDCGLRPDSELYPLRWENITASSIAVVDSKTPSGIREVPLGQRAKAILDMRRSRILRKSVFVFPGVGASGHIMTFKKPHFAACRAAGIRPFPIYALRHTFATRASRTVRAEVLARWMGHSSEYITKKYYVHLNRQDDAQELAKLEAARAVVQTQAAAPVVSERIQ